MNCATTKEIEGLSDIDLEDSLQLIRQPFPSNAFVGSISRRLRFIGEHLVTEEEAEAYFSHRQHGVESYAPGAVSIKACCDVR